MFGQLMDVIDDDYLRYIFHVEASSSRVGRARPGPGGLRRRRRPGAETGALAAALAAEQGADGPARHRRLAAERRPTAAATAGRQPRSSSPNAPDPDAMRAHRQGASTRRSGATTPAGAGAARSSSSATAPTDAGVDRPQTIPGDLDLRALGPLGDRLAEAERYLGLDKLDGPAGRARGRGGPARTCGTTPTTPAR